MGRARLVGAAWESRSERPCRPARCGRHFQQRYFFSIATAEQADPDLQRGARSACRICVLGRVNGSRRPISRTPGARRARGGAQREFGTDHPARGAGIQASRVTMTLRADHDPQGSPSFPAMVSSRRCAMRRSVSGTADRTEIRAQACEEALLKDGALKRDFQQRQLFHIATDSKASSNLHGARRDAGLCRRRGDEPITPAYIPSEEGSRAGARH